MRDIQPTDKFGVIDGKIWMLDEHGTTHPMCWKNLKDWAAWWTRQSELNLNVNLPPDAKAVFAAIFNEIEENP